MKQKINDNQNKNIFTFAAARRIFSHRLFLTASLSYDTDIAITIFYCSLI